MSTDAAIDLVCWDFGDTLVDEMFMRLPPVDGIDWAWHYEAVVAEHPDLIAELDIGNATLNDLIDPLAKRVALPRREIAKHLRTVWHRIEWFPSSRRWVERLGEAGVMQAVVTVNPHEFHGMAMACGLDAMVDIIVTSAETQQLHKPPMAQRARRLLGLADGLETTLLIDNKSHNTDDFTAAGGHSLLYTRETFAAEAERWLAPLLS